MGLVGQAGGNLTCSQAAPEAGAPLPRPASGVSRVPPGKVRLTHVHSALNTPPRLHVACTSLLLLQLPALPSMPLVSPLPAVPCCLLASCMMRSRSRSSRGKVSDRRV